MPVFPNKVPDLKEIGPTIEIIIYPSQPVLLQLKNEGKPVPSQRLIALIDTGASGSCIHYSLAKELGLIVRNVTEVYTPSGVSQHEIYDIGLSLPNLYTNIMQVEALGVDLEKQPFDALIGRDILSQCTLIYNGWDNSYQLHI